jgi:ABC-2 type transport system ATP-binding protein
LARQSAAPPGNAIRGSRPADAPTTTLEGRVTATATATIAATALAKRYGRVTALDGITFAVERGIIGLLGANGAGKSTLIKILLGLLSPDAGSAIVLGHDAVRDGVQARQWIGYMPEHDCLPDDAPAAEFVAHIGELSGLPPRAAQQRAADVLRYVGLDEERYRAMGGYSTGMKQRAKLAAALVHDPRLLLLDEPTNGLDPAGREQMLELILRTGRSMDMCIMMSTHLLADVEHVCDQVLVLEEGRLVRTGEIASFRTEKPVLRVNVGPAGAAPLAEALASGGDTTQPLGAELLVDLRDDTTYDRVRDAAAGLGLPLLRLTRVTSSLADLFRDEE